MGRKRRLNEDNDGGKLLHAYTGNIRSYLVVKKEFFCEINKMRHAEHDAITEKLADVARRRPQSLSTNVWRQLGFCECPREEAFESGRKAISLREFLAEHRATYPDVNFGPSLDREENESNHHPTS